MKRKGFTLIEILIVVSIIGLLASMVLVGLRGVQQRGRDAKRLADLKQLQNGLELYFSAQGQYPATKDALVGVGGITQLPQPPTTGETYDYATCGNNQQQYAIMTTLEDKSNQTALKSSASSTCNLACNTANGQYCVTN